MSDYWKGFVLGELVGIFTVVAGYLAAGGPT